MLDRTLRPAWLLEFPTANTKKWIDEFRSLAISLAGRKKIYLITSQRGEAEKFLTQNTIDVDGTYTCDATAIKTAARSNPTLFLMKGPVIQGKWGWADLDEVKN